ncbi:hypothetical protein BpPP18_28560 [Weizmannia acidilactici]|nr:hypothetical protein BpPP18_28560 [Weizmannia acidilactici]
MRNFRDMTIRELASQRQTVDDVQNMIRDLFKETLQTIFEAETVLSTVSMEFILEIAVTAFPFLLAEPWQVLELLSSK